MEHRETVRVYSFLTFDLDANDLSISKYKATREAIVSHFDGVVLEGTKHEVSRAELDQHGRYRRIATGWGELN